MNDNVHTKFLELIKKGAIGTLCEADCVFNFVDFCSVDSDDYSQSIERMSNSFYETVMKSSHPTLNPFMDDLKEYDVDTLREAIRLYITDKKTVIREKCDSKNDVITIRFDATVLALNCLPFFDQEEIIIKKADVQTALFKYKIED